MYRRSRRLVPASRRGGLTPETVARLAEAAYEQYGFNDFKLKGGVLRGEEEIAAVTAIHERFPQARVTLDPNGAWSLDEAIRLCKGQGHVLAYAEDPCGAEVASPARNHGRVPPGHRPAHRHEHDRHRLAADEPCDPARAQSIFPRRPAFLDDGRIGARGPALPRPRADLGLALEQPFRRVACDVHPCRGGGPRNVTAIDTHWIWQDGERLTKEPLAIRGGLVQVPERPASGSKLTGRPVEEAHALYRDHGLGARDDAAAMQFLIPDWTFDNKKPCLVR